MVGMNLKKIKIETNVIWLIFTAVREDDWTATFPFISSNYQNSFFNLSAKNQFYPQYTCKMMSEQESIPVQCIPYVLQ